MHWNSTLYRIWIYFMQSWILKYSEQMTLFNPLGLKCLGWRVAALLTQGISNQDGRHVCTKFSMGSKVPVLGGDGYALAYLFLSGRLMHALEIGQPGKQHQLCSLQLLYSHTPSTKHCVAHAWELNELLCLQLHFAITLLKSIWSSWGHVVHLPRQIFWNIQQTGEEAKIPLRLQCLWIAKLSKKQKQEHWDWRLQ